MGTKRMFTGFRYKLKEPYDRANPKYRYAQPAEYADGCVMGDCWIVDQVGRVHPGYCNSPVPLDASRLDLDSMERVQ